MLLHREVFTHSKLLHTEASTHSKLLHRDAFTQGSFYSHHAFTQTSSDTQPLLFTASFYTVTQYLLHTEAFTPRSF